ncbi:hypothetical protein [Flexistipes sp.]|uniref:hypothetical protein n=1 Tax=Flexistipes sp. TaxID=3088135 RepID=UPI002E1E0EF2|nr:hypothetical protein [Flexistipes sp.]
MILPKNGSVIVIDDDPNQAMPIIDLLAKKGIATLYFKGSREEYIPEKQLDNVRLAIVDLQLIESTSDEHTISTILINVLKNIIAPNNGPYMLLIWSLKDYSLGEEFKKKINNPSHGIVPICIASLEKSECIIMKEPEWIEESANQVIDDIESQFDKDDLDVIKKSIISNFQEDVEYESKTDAFEKIENSLENELKEAGVFHLFVIWENLVRKAGYQTVNAISSTIEYSDLWEANMRDVLKRMAKARTGQNTLSDELFMKAALSILSGSFSEELEYAIRKLDFPDYIKLDSPFSIAKKLNYDTYQISVNIDSNSRLKGTLFKNNNKFNGLENIKLDDFSQKITLPDDNEEKQIFTSLAEVYSDIPSLINTKLHIELEPSEGHMPGNVYMIDVLEERKKKLLPTYFENIPDKISDFHFVELEVSPICDYAQNKWKKSRLISGLVFPVGTKTKSGPFYKGAPVVFINNKKYDIIFNYLLFKALDIPEAENRGKFWFRIKRELLQDMIVGLSYQVNRPGITAVF